MPDLQKDLQKCLNDASQIHNKESDKISQVQVRFDDIRNKWDDKLELLTWLGSQVENMRSVSSKNIVFFNNMKQQINDVCQEATSKLSIKNAIIGKVD
jgi:hypothetical protein